MGSLSFKASIRKLWSLLRGRKEPAAASLDKSSHDRFHLFLQDREMASFEGGAAPLGYTSLRDLIPRGALPHRRSRSWDGTPLSVRRHQQQQQLQHHASWYGERPPIRNNLVELAARAYLQPTVVQREQPTQFLHKLWIKFTTSPAPSAAPPPPQPQPQPPAGLGFVGLLPSWMRVPFNFGPSFTWIFRQLRPQSTVLLRN